MSFTYAVVPSTYSKNYKILFSKNFFYRVNKAFKTYKTLKQGISKCADITKDAQIDSCSYISSNIVVIIGESYNKYHSSLYGYYLETSPLLSSLKDNGLYVFSNVISPCNITTGAMQCFLSFMSTDCNTLWYDTPLFPVLFRRAGYKVNFISNQFVRNLADISDFNYLDDYYLQHPVIDSALFDYRNSQKKQYDMDLIDSYFAETAQMNKEDSLSLTFFHLMGQHSYYELRYPREYAYFTKDSIKRPDLIDKYKQDIANYDNATRYNDAVIYNIINRYKNDDAIIIYLADHAEEIYDFRIAMGRTFYFEKSGANLLHNQFDIPFLVYTTNIYKERHPEIVKQIEASINKPFSTDDLPHMLLDLAGIKAKWYKQERSLINKSYNHNRKRLVFHMIGQLHDYDAICNK